MLGFGNGGVMLKYLHTILLGMLLFFEVYCWLDCQWLVTLWSGSIWLRIWLRISIWLPNNRRDEKADKLYDSHCFTTIPSSPSSAPRWLADVLVLRWRCVFSFFDFGSLIWRGLRWAVLGPRPATELWAVIRPILCGLDWGWYCLVFSGTGGCDRWDSNLGDKYYPHTSTHLLLMGGAALTETSGVWYWPLNATVRIFTRQWPRLEV